MQSKSTTKRPHPSGAAHWTKRTPDRIRRGTQAPGAKLTPAQILLLYAAIDGGANQSFLARTLGVSRMTVWRHLKERPEV